VKTYFNTGFYSNDVLNLTPKESFELCSGGAIIVDVREDYMISFKLFKVSNIIYMPFSEIDQLYNGLPEDKALIFADAVGLKSRESVIFMMSHGYDNIANMVGGIVDWERDGLPVETDISARLSGSCLCQLRAREGKKDNTLSN
jgi:rhodanese-related sulfurtransferase